MQHLDGKGIAAERVPSPRDCPGVLRGVVHMTGVRKSELRPALPRAVVKVRVKYVARLALGPCLGLGFERTSLGDVHEIDAAHHGGGMGVPRMPGAVAALHGGPGPQRGPTPAFFVLFAMRWVARGLVEEIMG